MKQRATRKLRRASKKTRRIRRGGAGPNSECYASQKIKNEYKAEKEHCQATGKGTLYGCKNSTRCERNFRSGKYCVPKMRDPCGW